MSILSLFVGIACHSDAAGQVPVVVDTIDAGDADGDGVRDELDCAPADPRRYPQAEERCDFIDQDCDGSALDVAHDRITTWRWGQVGPETDVVRYDADGHVRRAWSLAFDGAPEPPTYVAEYVDHRLVDAWDIGTSPSHEHIDRDAEGREISSWRDDRIDGVEEFRRACAYTADGGDCSVDYDGDGPEPALWRELLDNRQRVVQTGSPTGEIWSSTVYVEDDVGRTVRSETDDTNDGLADHFQAWDFDVWGRTTRFQDGAMEAWRVYETVWTDAARVSTSGSSDGSPDRWEREDFDARGQTTRTQVDVFADGVVELDCSFEYKAANLRVATCTGADLPAGPSYAFEERLDCDG